MANYFGATPSVSLEKHVSVDGGTTWDDADSAPGPYILVGNPVQWRYNITNTGNVRLTGITVTDDKGVSVNLPKTTLDPSESLDGTASGTAIFDQYGNVGTVTGTPPGGLPNVQASDSSHYFGTFVTYTRDEYSQKGTRPNRLLITHLNTALPSGLEVGYYYSTLGTGLLWEPNNAGQKNLISYLGGSADNGVITKDFKNPGRANKNTGGTLAAQTATLTINMAFSNLSATTGMPAGYGDLYYCNILLPDSLSGKTVAEIRVVTNRALSGQGLPSGYTFDTLNNLITNLNEAFDNGIPTIWAKTYLKSSCP
jgi:hypothetical protein